MLVASWEEVTTKTAVNCFRKCKISSESQKSSIAEDDDHFKELEKEIENLPSIQPDLVSENIDASSFTRVDAEVPVVQPILSDNEIVVELLETEDVSNDNDDPVKTEDELVYCPNRNEFLQIVEAMQNLPWFSKDGAAVKSYASYFACITDENSEE